MGLKRGLFKQREGSDFVKIAIRISTQSKCMANYFVRKTGLSALIVLTLLSITTTAGAAISLIKLRKTSSGSTLVTSITLNMPSSIPAGSICLAHILHHGTRRLDVCTCGYKRPRRYARPLLASDRGF